MKQQHKLILSGFPPETKRVLKNMAWDLLGNDSISALLRLIAERGRIEDGRLVVEGGKDDQKSR